MNPSERQKELISRAMLAVESIGVFYADADEAWESLHNALGDDPEWELVDRTFAMATDPSSYINPS